MTIDPSPRSIDEDKYVTNESKKASRLNCCFCNVLQKEDARTSRGQCVPNGSFTLYHAGRRDADRRLSCQWRPQRDLDFCGGQKSREKRGSRRSLSTNFHRLITTPTALGLLVSALGGTDR